MPEEIFDSASKSIEGLVRQFGHLDRSMGQAIRDWYAGSEAVQQFVKTNQSLEKTFNEIIKAYRGEQQLRRETIQTYRQWAQLAKQMEQEYKRLTILQNELNKSVETFSERAKRLHESVTKVSSGLKMQLGQYTGLTLSLRGLIDVTRQYNRTMYETGLIASRYGETQKDLEAQFQRIHRVTSLSRRGFADLNKAFKELYLGIPPTTKAVADFAIAMTGKLGYAEDQLIEKTKELLQTQQKIPKVFEYINDVMNSYTKSTEEGARASGRLRLMLRDLGASRQEIEKVMTAAMPVKPAILSYQQFERVIAEADRRTRDAELTLAQRLEPTLLNISKAMATVAESLNKISSGFQNTMATAMAFGHVITGIVASLGALKLVSMQVQARMLLAGAGGAGAIAPAVGGGSGMGAGSLLGGAGLFAASRRTGGVRTVTQSGIGTQPVIIPSGISSGLKLRGSEQLLAPSTSSGITTAVAKRSPMVGNVGGRAAPALFYAGMSGITEYSQRRQAGAAVGPSLGAAGIRGAGTGLGAWGGMAAGSAAGVAIGTSIGGALGSVAPFIGTAIGVAVGAYLGDKVGNWMADLVKEGRDTGGTDAERQRSQYVEQARGQQTRVLGRTMEDRGYGRAGQYLRDEEMGLKDIKELRQDLVGLLAKEDDEQKKFKETQDLLHRGLVGMEDVAHIFGVRMSQSKDIIREMYAAYNPVNEAIQSSQADLEQTLVILNQQTDAYKRILGYVDDIVRLQAEGILPAMPRAFEMGMQAAQHQVDTTNEIMRREFEVTAMAFADQLADSIGGVNLPAELKALIEGGAPTEYRDVLTQMTEQRQRLTMAEEQGDEKRTAAAKDQLASLDKQRQAMEETYGKVVKEGFGQVGIDFENLENVEVFREALMQDKERLEIAKARGMITSEEDRTLQQMTIRLGAITEISQRQLAVRQQLYNTIVKTVEDPFRQEINLNSQSIDLAKQRMTLAEQNNLGLVKSYHYTREVVGLMTQQISILEGQSQAYDQLIKNTFQVYGVNADVNSLLTDRAGTQEDLVRSMDSQGASAAHIQDTLQQLNTTVNKRMQTEKQILNLATEQAQLTRQVREGYLDAMQELVVNAGDFAATIGTTTKGVTQLIQAGAPSTFKYGGIGPGLRGGFGDVAPQWSAEHVGAMRGRFQTTRLARHGGIEGAGRSLEGEIFSNVNKVARKRGSMLGVMGRSMASDAGFDAVTELVERTEGVRDETITGNKVLMSMDGNLSRLVYNTSRGNDPSSPYGAPVRSEALQPRFYSHGIKGWQSYGGEAEGGGSFGVFGYPPEKQPRGGGRYVDWPRQGRNYMPNVKDWRQTGRGPTRRFQEGGDLIGSNYVGPGSRSIAEDIGLHQMTAGERFSDLVGPNIGQRVLDYFGFGFLSGKKPEGKAQGGYIIKKSSVDANKGLVKQMGGQIFRGGFPGKDSIPLQLHAKGGYALVQQGEALVTNPRHLRLAEAINRGRTVRAQGGGQIRNPLMRWTEETSETHEEAARRILNKRGYRKKKAPTLEDLQAEGTKLRKEREIKFLADETRKTELHLQTIAYNKELEKGPAPGPIQPMFLTSRDFRLLAEVGEETSGYVDRKKLPVEWVKDEKDKIAKSEAWQKKTGEHMGRLQRSQTKGFTRRFIGHTVKGLMVKQASEQQMTDEELYLISRQTGQQTFWEKDVLGKRELRVLPQSRKARKSLAESSEDYFRGQFEIARDAYVRRGEKSYEKRMLAMHPSVRKHIATTKDARREYEFQAFIADIEGTKIAPFEAPRADVPTQGKSWYRGINYEAAGLEAPRADVLTQGKGWHGGINYEAAGLETPRADVLTQGKGWYGGINYEAAGLETPEQQIVPKEGAEMSFGGPLNYEQGGPIMLQGGGDIGFMPHQAAVGPHEGKKGKTETTVNLNLNKAVSDMLDARVYQRSNRASNY